MAEMARGIADSGGGDVGGPTADLEMAPLKVVRPRWWCHALAAAFSAVFVAAPAVMLLDRRTPIVVEAVSLLPDPARPGDTMTMRWRAREYRACDGMVIRRFVQNADKIIRETISQATVYHGIADGKAHEFEIQFVIPNNFGPGRYTYAPVTIRWCNVLQKYLWPIVTYTQTIDFTVIDRPQVP